MNNFDRMKYKDIYGKMASVKSIEDKKKRLEQGLHTSIAPLGYKWERIGSRRRGHSVLVVDKYTSVIVKDLFRAYATGAYNYQAICDYINQRWELKKSKFSTQRVLENKFYRGILETKFGIAPHNYERIIDDELFDKVQEVIKSRQLTYPKAKQNTKNKAYLFAGLLKCGYCECQITVEKHKGIPYYHCTQSKGKHNAPWFNEARLTELIQEGVLPYININEFLADSLRDQQTSITQSELDAVFKNRESTREFLCFLFKKITFNQDKTVQFTRWSAQELASLQKREQKPVDISTIDPLGDLNVNILLLCHLPQSIDYLCLTLEKDLDTIQSALIDLQLDGKIDQNLEGLWVTL